MVLKIWAVVCLVTRPPPPDHQKNPAQRNKCRGIRSKWRDSTESQNHRMVGVGRDLCGSSSPTLLPKQGHLQQTAQDLVQALWGKGRTRKKIKMCLILSS